MLQLKVKLEPKSSWRNSEVNTDWRSDSHTSAVQLHMHRVCQLGLSIMSFGVHIIRRDICMETILIFVKLFKWIWLCCSSKKVRKVRVANNIVQSWLLPRGHLLPSSWFARSRIRASPSLPSLHLFCSPRADYWSSAPPRRPSSCTSPPQPDRGDLKVNQGSCSRIFTWFHRWPLIKVSGVHRSLLLLMGAILDKFHMWFV